MAPHPLFRTNREGWFSREFDRLALRADESALEVGRADGTARTRDADRVPSGRRLLHDLATRRLPGFAGDAFPDAFGSENGETKRRAAFSDVELHRLEDALAVSEARPIVDCVLSSAPRIGAFPFRGPRPRGSRPPPARLRGLDPRPRGRRGLRRAPNRRVGGDIRSARAAGSDPILRSRTMRRWAWNRAGS